MPTSDDDTMCFEMAVAYIKRLLTSKFKSLEDLAIYAPISKHCCPLKKTSVAPLEILDVDQSKTDNNVCILEAFQRQTDKSDDLYVVSKCSHKR